MFSGISRTPVLALSVVLAAALTSVAVANVPAASAARPTGAQAPFTANFFGVSTGAEITTLPDPAFDREMNLMDRMGVHWIRAVFSWSLVQPQDDSPANEEWPYLDRLVNYATALGMQVDAIVDNPPVWSEQSVPTISCAQQPSFNLTAYANFAAEVAARYPTSIVPTIELQNAPNLPLTWAHPDACGYTELMKQAYPAIKAANPDVLVLTGGLGAQNATRRGQHVLAGEIFFSQMYDNGAQGNFDALSWHPYSYPCTPSQSCPKARPWYKTPVVRQLMVDHGDGNKPIWATEFGAPTNGKVGDGHVSEADQSSIMVDGMNHWVALAYGGPFFVFAFRDHGTDATKKDDWFGLVSNDFKHKKTAYFTYKSLATGT